MNKKVSLAHSLPYTLFLGFGLVRLIYQYSVLNAISEIGRPSSTHAIGYLYLPFDAFVVGVIGLVIGFLFKAIILKVDGRKQVSLRWLIVISAFSVSLLGAFSVFYAYSSVEKYENRNAPQIIINSEKFHKSPVNKEAISIEKTTPAIALWGSAETEENTVSWQGSRIRTVVKDSILVEIISDDVLQTTLDLSGYTYITRLDVLPMSDYLVVLVKLRATSRRSMLYLFNSEFNVVYQEMLERCSGRPHQFIGLVKDGESDKLLIDLCEPFAIWIK